MPCEFCGFEFDEGCGRYGCPNCLGEGLDQEAMEGDKMKRELPKKSVRSDRIAIRVTPEDHGRLCEYASAAGMTLSEYVRWAALSYHPGDDRTR